MKLLTMKKPLFFAAIIYCCSLTIFAQNYSDQSVLAYAEQISGDKFTVLKKSPKGAKVYGVKKTSKQFLKAIDQGLTDLFAVARKNNYWAKLNYSDYTIFVANPDRLNDSAGNYSPGFAIPVSQYAGSIYDKGGYMFVAGMLVSNDPCAFLITEYSKELNRVSDVVRYEGEHLVLFHNDRGRYNATADHSKGGSHPILN